MSEQIRALELIDRTKYTMWLELAKQLRDLDARGIAFVLEILPSATLRAAADAALEKELEASTWVEQESDRCIK